MQLPDIGPLIPAGLPSGRDLVETGRRIGEQTPLGRTRICQEYGVESELAYKQLMQRQGRLMSSTLIGYKTWPESAAGIRYMEEEAARRGFRIDRFQVICDRRMGLPEELWDLAPEETGTMLSTGDHWQELGNVALMQPHLGQHMIGSPASVRNVVNGLRAGVTYIGNFDHFTWVYPRWRDPVNQTVETVQALAVMGQKRDQGVVAHTYLEDGFSAQFQDYASYIGYARLQQHIVETLCGARLSLTCGGLTRDPIMKSALCLALEQIRSAGTENAFYQADTTAFTTDPHENYAAISIDLLYMIMTMMKVRSAAAVLPIPVMEATRVPTAEELLEVQVMIRRIEEEAPRLMEFVDWAPIFAMRDTLVRRGEEWYQRAIRALAELGVDSGDPLQMLMALRRLGGPTLEEIAGVGERHERALRGFTPLFPTDTIKHILTTRAAIVKEIASLGAPLPGLKAVVGSTDIHEFAVFLVRSALEDAGIEVVDLGLGVDPDELAAAALETNANAIVVSTHNGMALGYARRVMDAMAQQGLGVPLYLGGKLNEVLAGAPTPVDVRAQLAELGVRVCNQIMDVVTGMRADAQAAAG